MPNLVEDLPIVYAVRYLMSKPLITVEAETAAQKAIQMMVKSNIGALIVTERGKLIGIVTERDILKNCCLNVSCEEVRVKEIMTSPLITIDAEAPLGEAVKVMTDKDIRRLLVTEDGKISGIVTDKDLMKGTLEAFRALASSS